MRYYNEFKSVYDSMPEEFSSFDFAKKARENGVPARITKQGGGRDFLKKYTNAKQLTLKYWQKNSLEIKDVKDVKDVKEDAETKISEAIKLLKENGYKILKPVNEWIEL